MSLLEMRKSRNKMSEEVTAAWSGRIRNDTLRQPVVLVGTIYPLEECL
jgi:hypothetical protein